MKEEKEKLSFKDLWENPQSKAAIKLLMYFIFIGGIVFLINVAPRDNGLKLKEKKSISIQEMQENLLNKDFNFEYIVVSAEGNKTIYKGIKKENKIEGTKENIEKTTKYYIDENGIYETILGEKIPLETLYENIDERFFDIEYTLGLISDKSTYISNREEYKDYNYNLLLDDINCEIIIRTDTEKIYNIYINYNDYIYDLNFS